MDFIETTDNLSVVDPAWELLDPNPNIQELFMKLNHMFFRGKLMWVDVKWSRRLTLKAGVCRYYPNADLCIIYLSQPLLSLRSRKDLVETLLHEMIHAFLYVTHKYEGDGAHGPEFRKHMERINNITGANISIGHHFHQEVAQCRKHWWCCDGICNKWWPGFGLVKRAMNRAPSARENWWLFHQELCGGTFVKVREPEGYVQKGKKRVATSQLTNTDNSGHELHHKRPRMGE